MNRKQHEAEITEAEVSRLLIIIIIIIIIILKCTPCCSDE